MHILLLDQARGQGIKTIHLHHQFWFCFQLVKHCTYPFTTANLFNATVANVNMKLYRLGNIFSGLEKIHGRNEIKIHTFYET